MISTLGLYVPIPPFLIGIVFQFNFLLIGQILLQVFLKDILKMQKETFLSLRQKDLLGWLFRSMDCTDIRLIILWVKQLL